MTLSSVEQQVVPSTLISFMHPKHELQLVNNGPPSICNICNRLVEGLYYCCNACGFDVHPLCTKQPKHVSYMPHPAHLLELSHCGTSSTCMICQDLILSWRYKCVPCGLDVHVECVNSSAPTVPDIQQISYVADMELNTSDQGPCLQPCNDECGQADKVVQGPSKRRRVFRFVTDLTVNVVCTIVGEYI